MKKIDLTLFLLYHFSVTEKQLSVNPSLKGLPTMKLAIRVLALSVVVAAAAAAAVTPKTATFVPSHRSATASFPIPGCGPHVPTCPDNGGN
jgi:hypothetical protein